MDVISSKGFQKWESGLHPVVLSCLFYVTIAHAFILESIAHNNNQHILMHFFVVSLNLRGLEGLN
jgi:hypothetical protein